MGAVVFFLALAAASGLSQNQPDFSGHWVLVRPERAGPDVAVSLIVQQPITRQNVYGAPMEPAYLRITIERRFATSTRTDTHAIGARAGTMSGPVRGADPAANSRTTVFTRWEDRRLVIDTTRSSSGTFASRTETWELDAEGRLTVTTTEKSSGGAPITAIAVYRRQ